MVQVLRHWLTLNLRLLHLLLFKSDALSRMLVKLDDAQVMPGSDLKKLKDAALLKTGFAIVIVGTE